jgi:hypothetical protein
VATGRIDSTSEEDRFRVLPVADEFVEPADGNATLRVIHASPDAPTISVDVGADGTVDIENLDRFATTPGAGIEIPAGQSQQVAILADGEVVTTFTVPELSSGQEVFIIATGFASVREDSRELRLLVVDNVGVLEDVLQNPVLFALHSASNAPAVDIFAGDMPVVQDLSFGELSAPVQVPPGTYTLGVAPAGQGPDAILATIDTPELSAGQDVLAAAAGRVPDSFNVLFADEDFPLGEPEARVRFIHAIPDAPEVDLLLVEEGGPEAAPILAENVALGEVTNGPGAQVPAGDDMFAIAPAETGSPVAAFDVPVAEGAGLFLVAAGAIQPGENEQPAVLLVVDTSVFPWTVEVFPPEG